MPFRRRAPQSARACLSDECGTASDDRARGRSAGRPGGNSNPRYATGNPQTAIGNPADHSAARRRWMPMSACGRPSRSTLRQSADGNPQTAIRRRQSSDGNPQTAIRKPRAVIPPTTVRVAEGGRQCRREVDLPGRPYGNPQRAIRKRQSAIAAPRPCGRHDRRDSFWVSPRAQSRGAGTALRASTANVTSTAFESPAGAPYGLPTSCLIAP